MSTSGYYLACTRVHTRYSGDKREDISNRLCNSLLTSTISCHIVIVSVNQKKVSCSILIDDDYQILSF